MDGAADYVVPGSPAEGRKGVDNCKVIVRIRPPISRRPEDDGRCIRWDNGVDDCLTPPLSRLLFPEMDRAYTFDSLLPPESSQRETYETCCHGMIEYFLEGFNCCLLAYGQTGSGKSYTMGTSQHQSAPMRHPEERGIVPRALSDFFAAVARKKAAGWEMDITVTFIEIYNEEIRDLLNPEGSSAGTTKPRSTASSVGTGLFGSSGPQKSTVAGGSGIRIAQDAQSNSIQLIGVRPAKADTEAAALECLYSGGLYRTTGSNKLNLTSSRSHAIFSLNLEQREIDIPVTGQSPRAPRSKLSSKFHLVDLAGSERIKRTQAQGSRLREGININSGLLALSNVINALTEERQGGSGSKSDERFHVPYRDSKLTRFLQDSLGGNSKTVMIACVTPARQDFAETFSTVKYASRARHIKNTPVVNKDPQTALIQNLRSKLDDLNAELAYYKSQEGSKKGLANIAELEREVADLKSVLQERETREAEERARRIALEARLVRYKNRYRQLLKDLKASLATPPEVLTKAGHTSCDDSDPGEEGSDDDNNLRSIQDALRRASDLELTVERLRQELSILQRTAEMSSQLVAPSEILTESQNHRPPAIQDILAMFRRIASERVDAAGAPVADLESGRFASGEDSTSKQVAEDENLVPVPTLPRGGPKDENENNEGDLPARWHRFTAALGEHLRMDERDIARLLMNATEDDRTELLALLDGLTGQAEVSEFLKSRSEKLSVSINRMAALLTGMEQEKRHWEKVVSDLSVQITSLQNALNESENQKLTLRARIEAIEEPDTSDGLNSCTPQARGNVIGDNTAAESVYLHRKLEQETINAKNNEYRLMSLKRELEEMHKRRETTRGQINSTQSNLDNLKMEKAGVLKRIAEQEKKHRASMMEKDRFIQKLEKQAKRTDEELVKERADKAEKTTKIQKLQKRNDELKRQVQSLQSQQPQPQPLPFSRSTRLTSHPAQSLPPQAASGSGVPGRDTFGGGNPKQFMSKSGTAGTGGPTGPHAAVLKRSAGNLSSLTGQSNAGHQTDRHSRSGLGSGGPPIPMQRPAEALERAIQYRLSQAQGTEAVNRKRRKLRRLDQYIDKLVQTVNQADSLLTKRPTESLRRQLLQMNDSLDSAKSERTLIENDITELKAGMDPEGLVKSVTDLRQGVRAAPDAFIDTFLDAYFTSLHNLEKSVRELARKNEEIAERRKLVHRAQQREEALIADFERQKIEIQLACNEDKVAFMEAYHANVQANPPDRSAAGSPEGEPFSYEEEHPIEAPTDPRDVELKILRERLELLTRQLEVEKKLNRQGMDRQSICQSPHMASVVDGNAPLSGDRRVAKQPRIRRAFSSTPNSRSPGPSAGERTLTNAPTTFVSADPSPNTSRLQRQVSPPASKRSPPRRNAVPPLTRPARGPGGLATQDTMTARADFVATRKASGKVSLSTGGGGPDGGVPSAAREVPGMETPSLGLSRSGGKGCRTKSMDCGLSGRPLTDAPQPDPNRNRSILRSPDPPILRKGASIEKRRRKVSVVSTLAGAHSDCVKSACFTTGRSLRRRPSHFCTGSAGEIRVWDLSRLESGDQRHAQVWGWRDCSRFNSVQDTFVSSLDSLEENVIVAAVGTTIKLFDLRCPGGNGSASTPQAAHSWILAPPGDVDDGPLPVANAICVMSREQHDVSFNLIAAAGSDKTVRIFDARARGALPLCKIPSADIIHSLAYVPPSDHEPEVTRKLERAAFAQRAINGLVTGSETGVLRLWNSGFCSLPLMGNPGPIRSLDSSFVRLVKGGKASDYRALFCCAERDERLRCWIWDEKTSPIKGMASVVRGRTGLFTHPICVMGGRRSDDDLMSEASSALSDWSSTEHLPLSSRSLGSEEDGKASSKRALICVDSLEATGDAVTGDCGGEIALWHLTPRKRHLTDGLIGDDTESPLEGTGGPDKWMGKHPSPRLRLELLRDENIVVRCFDHHSVNELRSLPLFDGSHMVYAVGDTPDIRVFHIHAPID